MLTFRKNTLNSRKMLRVVGSIEGMTNIDYNLCHLHPSVLSNVALWVGLCPRKGYVKAITVEPLKATLFRDNFCRCTQVKTRSHWVRVGCKSNMTGVLVRGEHFGHGDADTQAEVQVEMETESRVIHSQE